MKDKEQSALEYANSNFELCHYTYTDDKRLTDFDKIKEAWLAGYETAVTKWNNVDECVPDSDRKVLCYINNTETPEWSGYRIGAYLGSWYCEGGRKSYEIVEKWTEIPR